jgi:putative transposase
MEEIMRVVCADFETELVEFNGENNHVHLLVNFPPKVALTKLVNSLKGVSSRRMRQEFPDLVRHYYRANKLWSGSYFAGSVGGAPLRAAGPPGARHCSGLDGPSQRGPSPPH